MTIEELIAQLKQDIILLERDMESETADYELEKQAGEQMENAELDYEREMSYIRGHINRTRVVLEYLGVNAVISVF